MRSWRLVAGMGTIVSLGLCLRLLELRAAEIVTFIPPQNLHDLRHRPWMAFLPLTLEGEPGGYPYSLWSTTGLVGIAVANRALSPPITYLLLYGITIILAFFACRGIFGSNAVGLVAAATVAFGTQLTYVYVNSSAVLYYPFLIYLYVNLLSLWKIAWEGGRGLKWRLIFVGSLIALALCREIWLDYFVFLMLFCLILRPAAAPGADRVQDDRRRAVRFAATVVLAVAIAYLG